MSNLNHGPKKKVFIVGHDYQIGKMFDDKGWERSPLEECSLVVFTGGSDVDPSLYGEENFASYSNLARDKRETEFYNKALEHGKCMVGICRGGQFLNVMNGGKMIQHVENHAGRDHKLTDVITGEEHSVTSTHHQMMIPNEKTAEVVATAGLGGAKYFFIAGKITQIDQPVDIEVVYYDDTASLCFQPHPEYANKECREYFFDLLNRKFDF